MFSIFGNDNVTIEELGQLWAYLNSWLITGTIGDNKETNES